MHQNTSFEESDVEQTWVEVNELEKIHFNRERVLVIRLSPVQLPCSQYHSDFLVNLIHDKNEHQLNESATCRHNQTTEYTQELSQGSDVLAVGSRGSGGYKRTHSCSVEYHTHNDCNHDSYQCSEGT